MTNFLSRIAVALVACVLAASGMFVATAAVGPSSASASTSTPGSCIYNDSLFACFNATDVVTQGAAAIPIDSSLSDVGDVQENVWFHIVPLAGAPATFTVIPAANLYGLTYTAGIGEIEENRGTCVDTQDTWFGYQGGASQADWTNVLEGTKIADSTPGSSGQYSIQVASWGGAGVPYDCAAEGPAGPNQLENAATVTYNSAPATPGTPAVSQAPGTATINWGNPNSDSAGNATFFVTATPVSGPGALQSLACTSVGPTTCVFSAYNAVSNPYGLVYGETYSYAVQAEDAEGLSPVSPSSPAAEFVGKPADPTDVVATAVPGPGINLSWNAPAQTGGSPITSYTITPNAAGITCYQGKFATTTSCGVSTGLTLGESYDFTVSTVTAEGSSAGVTSNPVLASNLPSAPTGLAPAVTGPGTQSYTWTPPANDGGSPITGYTLTATPQPSGTPLTCSTVATPPNPAPTTCQFTGVSNSQQYVVWVTDTNEVGSSPESNPVATTVAKVAPSAPTSVVASAGNANALVSWIGSTNDGGDALLGYVVTSFPGGLTCTTPGTSCTVSGLTNGTGYLFTVAGTNAAGTGASSAPSNTVTPLDTPSAPSITSATAGNGSAAISWTVPVQDGGSPITHYTGWATDTTKVTNGGETCATPANTTSCTISGLTNGDTYTFTVTPANNQGTGAASVPSGPVYPSAGPSAPTSTTATPISTTQVNVSWLASSVATGDWPVGSYLVVWTDWTAGTSGTACTTLAANQAAGCNAAVIPGDNYTFSVSALNTRPGGGLWSAAATTASIGIPAPPTNVVATPGSAPRTVNLSWSAPAKSGTLPITYYNVQVNPGGQFFYTTGPATSITVTGLSNNTNYTFSVFTQTNVWNSPAAVSNALTTINTPGAPTIDNANTYARPGSAVVAWTAPASNGGSAITGYTVTATGGQSCTTTTTSCTISGLVNGGGYTFTVTATNFAGVGPASVPSVAVYPLTIPNAPTNVIAAAGSNLATVSWTASSNAATSGIAEYTVESASGNFVCATVTTTSCSVSGLTNGTSYSFTVVASNANGYGPSSTISNSVTPLLSLMPAITSAPSASFVLNSGNTFTVQTGGFPAASWLNFAGTLPNGVTFKDNGDGTATISGTPANTSTLTASGTWPLLLVEFDGVSLITQNFTLTVTGTASVISAPSDTFTIGQAGSFAVMASGSPAPVITESGVQLPQGVSWNPATDVLSGTPAAGTAGTYQINFTATSSSGSSTQGFTLTVNAASQAPNVTSANGATFPIGQASLFTPTATGTPVPVISESGVQLPTGVNWNAATGVLSGTPAVGTAGTYQLSFTATNSAGSNSMNFTLTVGQSPNVVSATGTTFTVNQASSFAPVATGSPAPVFTESGALPQGVNWNAATGVLSGTPAVGMGKNYPITFTAMNSIGSSAPQAFLLTVDEASSITSSNTMAMTAGAAGTFTVTTRGFPIPAISDNAGAGLPPGVNFIDNGDGTATISGTPPLGSGNSYTVTLTPTNGTAQPLTINVAQAAAFTTGATATFTVGSLGNFPVITAGGFPTPAITETGALPTGVQLNDNHNGTATLTGTPAVGQGGLYNNLTLHAGGTSLPFALTVDEAPSITSAAADTFNVGSAGAFNVTATGYPAATFTETGAPTGVNISPAGVLSGTPNTAGSSVITITATSGSLTNTQTFTLNVTQSLSIPSAASDTFTTGMAGTFTVTSVGSPTPALSAVGQPAWLSVADNHDGTATMSGTPPAGSGNTYHFTITAGNGVGQPFTQAFVLTVDQAPAISSLGSATFTAATAGNFTVVGTGLPAPTYAVTAGSLPAGVNLSSAGVLSGTPSATSGATYPVTITASNGVGQPFNQPFVLTVNQTLAFTNITSTTLDLGAPSSFNFVTTGFPVATQYTTTSPLPGGMNLSLAGVLSGTPNPGTAQSWPIVVSAMNGVGNPSTQNFVLTVGLAPTITSASSDLIAVGGSLNFAVTATGFPAPAISMTSGALPPGISLTSAGILTGSPATGSSGVYTFGLQASNGVAPAQTETFTLTVTEKLSVTSAARVTFPVGAPMSFQLTASGGPNPIFAVQGAPPTGLNFDAATGVISGTATTPGVTTVIVKASNGFSTATQTLQLTVNTAAEITSANTATFDLLQASNFPVTSSGLTNPSYSESGKLPFGINFGGGAFFGTPTAVAAGTYPITLTANGNGQELTQSFSLVVEQPPTSFTSALVDTFNTGTAGTFTFATAATPAATFSETGALPQGVSFTNAGVLSGSPAAGTGGIYQITVQASNGIGASTSTPFTLTVIQPLQFTSAASTTWGHGQAGTYTITVSGYPTATISTTGATHFPAGVIVHNNGNGTATLSGTPSTAGSYTVTIQAVQAGGTTQTQSFTLTVV